MGARHVARVLAGRWNGCGPKFPRASKLIESAVLVPQGRGLLAEGRRIRVAEEQAV